MKKELMRLIVLLSSSLAIALLFDVLFYRNKIGVSFTIFAFVLTTGTLLLARRFESRIDGYTIALSASIILLSIPVFIRASEIITIMNIAACIYLYVILLNRFTSKHLSALTPSGYACLPFSTAGQSLIESSLAINSICKARNSLAGNHMLRQVGRGLAIALPIIVVFSFLFASADLVFKKHLIAVAEFIKNLDFIEHTLLIATVSAFSIGAMAFAFYPQSTRATPAHDKFVMSFISRLFKIGKVGSGFIAAAAAFLSFVAAIIVLISASSSETSFFDRYWQELLIAGPLLCVSIYLYALYRYSMVERTDSGDTIIACKLRRLTFIESSILLGAIDLLFIAFVTIQFAYLFNGKQVIVAQGFSYAEYAHRGFFELLAVAISSFIVIWNVGAKTYMKDKRQSRPIKILSMILGGLTMIIMASAFERLSIYEAAYGFTILRVYTQAFIISLGMAFTLLLYKIVKESSNAWFSIRILAIAIAIIVGLSIGNPERIIAKLNIDRYEKTHDPDLLMYNIDLSSDAIDEVIYSFYTLGRNHDYYLVPLRTLEYRRAALEKESWQSFNLARNYELKQLKAREGNLHEKNK